MKDDTPHSERAVKETAAYWAMRLASEDCGPADRAAFIAWRDEHPARAAIFERTERALRTVDRHMGHPELEAMSRQVLEETAPKQRAPRRWLAAGLAAAVLLVAGLSAHLLTGGRVAPAPDSTLMAQTMYETAVGERSTVTLPDGSVVTLNTNSRIRVGFAQDRRAVELENGQAFFEVAKDASRPFVVKAGNQQITAIGTSFDVRFDTQAEISVVLVEGRVAVDEVEPLPSKKVLEQAPEKRIEMSAGERLVANATEGRKIRPADVEDATSWRNGRLIFRGEPLAEAVAEVNRYTTSKLQLVDDPRLEEITVSGVFNVGRLESFVLAVTSVHSIEARKTPGGETELTWRE